MHQCIHAYWHTYRQTDMHTYLANIHYKHTSPKHAVTEHKLVSKDKEVPQPEAT